jgi:hypothetical protein
MVKMTMIKLLTFFFQPDPVTETLTKEAGNAIQQISLLNPILGLLLIVLIALVIGLCVVVYKLSKKVNEQSTKLYEEAKADFELVLAFEKKLDTYLEKDNYLEKDVREIKDGIQGLKTYLEIIHKK